MASPLPAWLARLQCPRADLDYHPGHERFLRLLERIGPLHRPRWRVRVAGTNGKGSTAHMLAAALRALGLRVGLYTSPHILRFHERIRVDGQPIDDDSLLGALRRIVPHAERIGASPFETASALALEYFSHRRVDVEILEAGVGARLDTCTAVDADMGLITPIALDHQAWLGDTLSEIAREKAHALDGCRWALTGADTQAEEVLRILRARHSCLRRVPCDTRLRCRMPGRHQQANASLALAGAELLRQALALPADVDLRRAVCEVQVPGRLHALRLGTARIWLDAAHNPHAMEALRAWCAERAKPFDGILVMTREDRDLSAEAEAFRPYAREFCYLRPCLSRHREAARASVVSMVERRPMGEFLVLGSFQSISPWLETSTKSA